MDVLINKANIPDIISNKDFPNEERKIRFRCIDSTGDERHGGLIGMANIDSRFYRKFFKDGTIYVCDLENETETLDTTGAKILW